MKNDIEGFVIPDHGTLIGWATQGIEQENDHLLINPVFILLKAFYYLMHV